MSLDKTARYARAIIAISLSVFTLYAILFFSYPYMKKTLQSMFPKKQEPVLTFGKLPKIKALSISVNKDPKPLFELNTSDGRLPAITPAQVVNVYKVIKPSQSFSAGKDAQQRAQALLFTPENLSSGLTGNIYKWIDPKFSRSLEINISTGTIKYLLNPVRNTLLYTQSPDIASKKPEEEARAILEDLGHFTDELYGRGTNRITFGKVGSERIEETTTPQEYTFTKVDFFRTIYKVPIVSPRFDDSPLQVILAKPADKSALKDTSYIGLSIHEWSVITDLTKVGKYPPLPIEEAWKQLVEGNGIYAKLKLRNSGTSFDPPLSMNVGRVSIEDAFVGYLDSYEYQEYLQPVYVFTGTFTTQDNKLGDAVIYYPAVNSTHIQD